MEAEKRTKNVTIYATETATVMPSNSQPVLGGVKSGTTRKATTQTTVSSWWAPETLTTMLATSSSGHVADAKTSHGAPSEYPNCGDQPPSEPAQPALATTAVALATTAVALATTAVALAAFSRALAAAACGASVSRCARSNGAGGARSLSSLQLRHECGVWRNWILLGFEAQLAGLRWPGGRPTVYPTGYPTDTIYFQFLDDYSGDTSECVTNAECHDLCRRWDPCRGYEIKVPLPP